MKYTYRHKKFTAVFTDEDGYFNLTGDVEGGSGACGDKIAKIDGRFRLMNSMHLCDVKTGVPMHVEANALYWAKKGSGNILSNHLRISIEDAMLLIDKIVVAGVIGTAIGEKSKKDEMARVDDLRHKIRAAMTTPGKTIYDIFNGLKSVNNNLRKNMEKVKMPTEYLGNIYDIQSARKVRDKMLESLEKTMKAAQKLPQLQADTEQKQVMETYINGLRERWAQEAKDVVKQAQDLSDEYKNENETDNDVTFDWDKCNEPAKVKALSKWLECYPENIEEISCDEFEAHGRTYLVMDDEEANRRWDEYLDNYIDDCLEIPEQMINYFDRNTWKEDARMDGRGHSLGSYDGNEYDVTVEHNGKKETYYIYRQ